MPNLVLLSTSEIFCQLSAPLYVLARLLYMPYIAIIHSGQRVKYEMIRLYACADPEMSVRGVHFFLFFKLFFIDEGRGDPKTTINEPSSARQRNGTFKWVTLAGR